MSTLKESDLIFGLMATFNKPEYSIEEFKYLLKPFRISESCLRTTLCRMAAKNIVQTCKQGRKALYSFTKSGELIKDNIALGFEKLDWSNWKGNWLGVLFSIPDLKKQERYNFRKNLLNYRFRPLYPGVWIRPFNSKEDVYSKILKKINKKLCEVVEINYLEDISREKVVRLWELKEINKKIKQGIKILEKSQRQIKTLSSAEALVEKMVVGNKIVKILFLDPLLPTIFLPKDWQGGKLKAMFGRWVKTINYTAKPYWIKIFRKEEQI